MELKEYIKELPDVEIIDLMFDYDGNRTIHPFSAIDMVLNGKKKDISLYKVSCVLQGSEKPSSICDDLATNFDLTGSSKYIYVDGYGKWNTTNDIFRTFDLDDLVEAIYNDPMHFERNQMSLEEVEEL